MLPKDKKRRPRGRCEVLRDSEVRPAHVADYNLILFGRPETNVVLRRIADRLPIRIEGPRLRIQGRVYEADAVGLRLACPNPLNPERNVVVWFGHMPILPAKPSPSRANSAK